MADRKVLALLSKGRKWFEKPNSTVRDWSHYVERNREGKICRRCIFGGIGRTNNHTISLIVLNADSLLRRAFPGDFNPSSRHTRAEVLAIYDKAIKLAQEQADG